MRRSTFDPFLEENIFFFVNNAINSTSIKAILSKYNVVLNQLNIDPKMFPWKFCKIHAQDKIIIKDF